MKNNNESPLNSNSNISTEPLKLLGKHSPKEEKLNKNILDDNKEFMKNIVCSNTVDVPTEPIAIHRLILSKSSKLVVVMMPQVNKVLKNIFQIMSQANYYLQKFGIIAKRFNGEQLMSLKIMSLVKNDVKVCSYISYEESQTLMNAFTRNPAIKKNGDFYYTERINLDRSDINFKKPLKLEFDISIETPMHVTENNKIILNIINRNETKFVLIDSLLNVIGCENEQKMQKLISDHSIHIYSTSTNTTVNEYHQAKNTTEYKFIEINDSIFIMKIFLPRIAQCDNFESLITYNLINDIQIEQYPKDNKSNIELQKPLHIGEKKLPSNEVGIDLNVYLLSGDKIVAMPDINKIIRTAHGCLSKDIPGVHGALLRQVNYYLGKLKTQKKKFNFGQMKAVKHFGTEIGNATYCSYVSLEDATKIFDIFKTFSLKFPSVFSKINFNGPISLDDSVLIRINKAKITSKKTRKKDKREKIFNEENRHKIKLPYFTINRTKMITITDIQACLSKILDPELIPQYLDKKTFKNFTKPYKVCMRNGQLKNTELTNIEYCMNIEDFEGFILENNIIEKCELYSRICWEPAKVLTNENAKNDQNVDEIKENQNNSEDILESSPAGNIKDLNSSDYFEKHTNSYPFIKDNLKLNSTHEESRISLFSTKSNSNDPENKTEIAEKNKENGDEDHAEILKRIALVENAIEIMQKKFMLINENHK